MLRSLQIRNYVLIDSLDVDFPEGLVIITGQTGAGKSILLGALSLLMGAKTDASVIGDGGSSCVVEAVFQVPGTDEAIREILDDNDLDFGTGEILVRRVVAPSGRSRSFVNDSPVNIQTLTALSSRLVDIHSQHQTLMLSDRGFQLGLLDRFCGNGEMLKECRASFGRLKSLERELEDVRSRLQRLEEEQDYVQSRWTRLDAASLREGELEELQEEQKTLANAEAIKENLFEVERLLDSLPLKDARRALQRVGEYLPSAAALAQRMESARAEIEDILQEVSSINSSTELSGARLEEVESRMSELYGLMKKYSASSVGELIAQRDSMGESLQGMDSLRDRRDELMRSLEKERTEYQEICAALHKSRASVAAEFSSAVLSDLRSLDLERAGFEVALEDARPTSTGSDEVRFLFSASGGSPVELSKCASGGELSRLMLCLKAMMARFVNMPTLIFDEIDSGVSGSAADKMGRMICSMGAHMQVFAITHLPQVAAKGNAHYLVQKEFFMDKAISTVRPITGEDRVMEIARMLSGSRIQAAAIENAKALLSDKSN